MKCLAILIIVLAGLYILNMFFVAIYCRIERKVDSILSRQNDNEQAEKSSKSCEKRKNKVLVSKLKKCYKYVDSYFYGWMRYWQIRISRYPSNRVRKIFYKYIFCMNICQKTVISSGCEIRSPWNIQLGNCIIAGNCILDGRSRIIIGDNVVLGMNVHIWTQEHDINSPTFAVTPEHKGAVIINERAWICSDSTILPNVTIGEGAVVASKALINRDCESYGVYGGVPAIKISERSKNLTYVLSGKPHWHFN